MSIAQYQNKGLLVEEPVVQQNNAVEDPERHFVAKTQDITVLQTHTPYGLEEETVHTSEYMPPPKKKSERVLHKNDKFAVLIRRVVQRRRNHDVLIATELCVQSVVLCQKLREIVGETYDSFDICTTPIVMAAPFYELFFNKDAIALLSREAENPSLRDEAQLLATFIEKDELTISKKHEYRALLLQNKIGFTTLWTLYPPNTRLYRVDGEALECWLCCDLRIDTEVPLLWHIMGTRLAYDGAHLGLEKVDYPISFANRVDRTVNISDLPLLPENHVPPSKLDGMKKQLVERGNRFRDIMQHNLDGHAYRFYRGPLWSKYDLYTPPEAKLKESVVVDYKEYLHRFHRNSPRLRRHANDSGSDDDSGSEGDSGSEDDSHPTLTMPNNSMTPDVGNGGGDDASSDAFAKLFNEVSEKYKMESMDDLLIHCPARIPAYGLQSKKWGWVLLSNLHPVQPSDTAFRSLQLDRDTKDLVYSLVRGHHGRPKDNFDDFTANKGKGLVMLLHGEPGVGKTLTAESIAASNGSPLYSVSGGELGVDVTIVERKLRDIFELGKRWKAIVLLDEADVIMSKRSSTEIERNAIVAVWLRMIEYFAGVLFLTSNRVDDFDDAFRSRIHLTVRMDALDNAARREIWRSLIGYNKAVVDASSWNEEAYSVLSNLDVNGRVIKNLIRTAMSYAQASGPSTQLCVSHIYKVIKVELASREDAVPVLEKLGSFVKAVDEKRQLARSFTAPLPRGRRV